MSGVLAVLLGYMFLVLHRNLVSYVPDGEPVSRAGKARRHSRRRTVVVVLTLAFAGTGAFLLALRTSLMLFLVWHNPSLGTFNVMMGNALLLAGGLVGIYAAWLSLRSEGWPSRKLRPQRPVSSVYPVPNIDYRDIQG